MKTSIRNIAEALGADSPELIDYDIDTLLTDSRELTKPSSSLFFAIATKSNDGHRYIPALYEAGVRNFAVTRSFDTSKYPSANFLLVSDTIAALQQAAALAPAQSNALRVAVAGSLGKTTVKEWLYRLLESDCQISRSPRSYNSQIGVPLSVWQTEAEADLALIETAATRPGEMQKIAACLDPHTVIVTNYIDARSGDFADGQAMAEATLPPLLSHARTVIFPADNQAAAGEVAKQARRLQTVGWSLSHPDADLYAQPSPDGHSLNLDYIWKKGSKDEIKGSVRCAGTSAPDLENTMSALAFMLCRGMSPSDICERFEHLRPIDTRLEVKDGVNGCQLVTDGYASDLTSLPQALGFIRRRAIPGQTTTAVISDLHHDTTAPELLYAEMARLLANYGIDRFIGVGPQLMAHRNFFPADARIYPSVEAMMRELRASDFSNEIVLVKDSPEYPLQTLAQLIETRTHETVLEVNLDAIVKNYKYFKQHLPASTGIVGMVKAFGYGAGSYEIAKTLQDAGAAYLAVAVLDEGIALRRKGITMPIMVMNPMVENYRTMFAHRLEPEIYSFAMLADVMEEARRGGISDYPIHIKLDTGMHRMGFVEEELPRLMDILEAQGAVKAKSVFSHLATADCPDMNDYTEAQLELFARATDYMESRSSHHILRHVLNSAGILRYPQYHYDMARLGIGLYGANTLPPDMEKPLEVVSTLRTVIISIREWEAGQTVGYGRRGVLKRRSRIATIPIGYADGMNRHFGRGRASVMIGGKEAPTVGNICMDACMVDVTDIDCRVGDSVEVFGPNMPVQRLSDLLDTIPYEIFTSISQRVKRVYYRE